METRPRRNSIQIVVATPQSPLPSPREKSGTPSPRKTSSPRSPMFRFLNLNRRQRSGSMSEPSWEDALEQISVGSAPSTGGVRRRHTGSLDSWTIANNLYTANGVWKTDVSLIEHVRGFTYEEGTKKVKTISDLSICDTLKSVSWYSLYFYGREHSNYICRSPDSPMDICIVSVIKEDPELTICPSSSPRSQWSSYKIIVRTKEGDEKRSISLRNSVLFSSNKIRIQEILENGFYHIANRKLEKIRGVELCEDLQNFEERQIVTNYKFGVLYCGAGQRTEEDMFSNENGSPDFEEFLDTLGTRIELQGWEYFKGGLDVKFNTTGTHSLYTTFHDYELMFHVSTMLPLHATDRQQIERKRHLGNDIAIIVFKEGDQLYHPEAVQSHFNHIIIVVSKVEKRDKPGTFYKVAVANKEGVPHYSPDLPDDPVIEKSFIREFLLCKLINGEDAAMNSPTFNMRVLRTRIDLLKEIINKF